MKARAASWPEAEAIGKTPEATGVGIFVPKAGELSRGFLESWRRVEPVGIFARQISPDELGILTIAGRTITAMVATAAVLIALAGSYYLLGGPMMHPEAGIPAAEPAVFIPSHIDSFAIEPSHRQGGWRLYLKGAKAVVKGRGLAEVEIRYHPTGADTVEASPGGVILGRAAKSRASGGGEVWNFTLPNKIVSTNFWIVVTDVNGKRFRGPDLGNVGYEK